MTEFIVNYWQPTLYSLLTLVVVFISKKITCQLNEFNRAKVDLMHEIMQLRKEVEKNSKASRTALYISLYKEYATIKQKGYITIAERKNIEHIYEGYHGLGGNHTGTSMYEELMSMEVGV